MGHFFRIRKSCGCCGSLRAGSIVIGIIYLLLAVFGATVDDLLVYARISYSPSGPCLEVPFLRIWQLSSLVSVFINLAMIYGALAEKSLLVAPWLAWHLVLPFIQVTLILWSGVEVATCASAKAEVLKAILVYIISTNAATLLPLLYFATVVYSFYKDLSEGSRRYNSDTNILLPSTNWDAEMTPYTGYDSGRQTPTVWGSLKHQQHTRQGPPLSAAPPPPQQQRQTTGIPRLPSHYDP